MLLIEYVPKEIHKDKWFMFWYTKDNELIKTNNRK